MQTLDKWVTCTDAVPRVITPIKVFPDPPPPPCLRPPFHTETRASVDSQMRPVPPPLPHPHFICLHLKDTQSTFTGSLMALASALLPPFFPPPPPPPPSPPTPCHQRGSRLLCGAVINGAMGKRVGQRPASSGSSSLGRGRRSGLFNGGEKLHVM